MIEFARPDGGRCKGYLAEAGKGRPAVIVIQEWWGLNPQIRGIADRYAAAGFTALAPDLFQGRVTQDPDEASHLMNGLDFPGATHQDIRGAARHLASFGGKVGVTGYCMGGALTIAAAVHVPEVAAAVCLYGIPPRDFADPADIRVPFQGHFATHDDWCNPAAVAELEARMQAHGAAPEIFRYDAQHAFCNEARPEVYDAMCAADAWSRTLAFFGKHLA
jgi:carboxymethylenebutenolidase